MFHILIVSIFIISLGGCTNKTDLKNLRIIFESSMNAPAGIIYPQRYIELYVMNPDGSNIVRLTTNFYWEHKPQVSPDGKNILFSIHFSPENVDETNPGWEIAVMSVDGTGFRRLTNNSYFDGDAKWNADGTKIVFVSDSNHRTSDDFKNGLLPQYDIYIMNPDGSDKKRLTFGKPGDVNADPCFSPSGFIYYVHSKGYSNNFDLWKMNEDGKNKTIFFMHNDLIKAINDPSVLYDDSRIIFEGRLDSESPGGPRYNLFTIDTTRGSLTRITYGDESDVWPSFSPDGLYIVYFTYIWDSKGGHTQEIRIAKYGGSEERGISSYPWESFPSWFKNIN